MAKQAKPEQKPTPEPTDIQNRPGDAAAMISSPEALPAEHSDAADPEEWPTFDPSFLQPSTSPAPRFPIEALPLNLRLLILDFAEARVLSVDYVAASILAACSGAIGNRARLLSFDGEAEPLAIFAALVGSPSVGKSLGITVVERPLIAIDQAMQKAHGLMLKGADHKFLEKFDQKLREIVARRLLLEGIPLENETSDGDGIVAAPGIILSECSGAGLLDELRTGIDGRMMVTHELSAALAFGASNQGLRSRGLILQGYDGKPHIVRTKSEGKVVIPALLVSILGATQPSRLPALLGDAHDGMAARTWWIYPDVEARVQLPRASGPVERLSALLTRLVAIMPACTRECYSALVPLAAETREPLETAERHWLQLRTLTDGLYRDFIGRASQHAMRLAAILAITEHSAAGNANLPQSVDPSNMEAAIDIVGSYLLPMAERVLNEVGAPKDGDAARLARFLARGGKSVINVRADILRAAGSPVRDAQNAAEALEELRRRHAIRAVEHDATKLGRPAQLFEVHPALLAHQWKA